MKISRTARISAPLVATALALTACSGGSKSGSSAPPKTVKLTTSVTAPSGEAASITWNLGNGEPSTLDPAQSSLENVSTVVSNLCEQLMVFDKDYKLKPGLAAKVTQPDAKTFVFQLRDGATFWNGAPVTADDVVYSIKRTFAKATASSWAAAYADVAAVEKTGASQVTVKFKNQNAMYHWYEATPATAVVQKSYTEKAGKAFGTGTGGLMCSGPYKLDSWTSGQDIVISRNDHYWGAKPLVKKVKFTFDTDTASRTAALVRGDYDGQWANSVSSLKRLQGSGAGSLLYGSSMAPVFISEFTQDPAIKNADVRQALRLLVDYQGITESVYGGAATTLKSLTGPSTWGYSTSIFKAAYDRLPARKQDLAEAKKLVQKAGDVAPLTLAYDNSSTEESKIALSLQSAAAQVGLTIKLRSLASNDYLKIFYEEKAREGLSAYVVNGYLDFPEPLEYDEYATQGSYYNYTGYDNPKYNALIKKAAQTLDDDQRAALITQAEALASADAYTLPIVSPYINVFVNKRLTGLVPTQNYLYTPWAASLGAVK
ncbi:ABC transporter substrate-binding protein [Actinomadura nitritigenes]|uniref:ABC transporter substrate-binding protein n=1 Tax=Actinomadura nitritigenes TaxID=134602 RepID=UPI003D8C986B